MDWDVWAKCAVEGCENKQCLRLNSIYCYPHSNREEDQVVKQLDKILEPTEEVERA